MKFLKVVQRKPQLVHDGKRQHSVGFPTAPSLLFCSIEEGLSNFDSLRLHEVHENVHASEVSHPSRGIITSNVSLLNRSAGTLLGSLDVVAPDVLLFWNKSLPL